MTPSFEFLDFDYNRWQQELDLLTDDTFDPDGLTKNELQELVDILYENDVIK